MLGFSQLSKPIKWQDLLEKGKNGRNASRTGTKIHFSDTLSDNIEAVFKLIFLGDFLSSCKENGFVFNPVLRTFVLN